MDTSKSERKKHKKSSKEKKSRKSSISENNIKVENSDSDESEQTTLKISSDDEIFLVQCSKNVNVQKLIGAKLKFYGESLYNDNEIECKQENYKEQKFVTLLNGRSNGPKAFSFIPAGKIIIKEKIDFEPVDEYDNSEVLRKKKSVIPMPENLQVRHPLLGIDYKNKLQLDESVLEKLKEAANISIKKSPKRKIKKEKLVKMEVEDEQEFIKVEKPKSPRKRSKIEREEEPETPAKKSKKIKKEKPDVSMELDWISNL